MAVKISILFISTILLIDFTNALNECYQEGVTWDTEGQIAISLQVDFKQCIDLFLKNEEGKGFTWFKDFNGYEEICLIFGELNGQHHCIDCIRYT